MGILYRLRYKQAMTGVREVYLEIAPKADAALEQAAADAVGRAYCNSEPGRVFISTARAVVADESILPMEAEAAPEKPAKRGKAA